MLRNRKNLLTTKILDNIPKNIKPIEYLIQTLEISKESAYRRLRGEIPFTFEEISKLSLELNFLVDELIAKPDESRVLVNIPTNSGDDPSTAFLKKFEQYYQFLLHLENYPDVETVLTLNHIPAIASIHFKNLFKFFYFKWLHQSSETSLKLNYSEVIMPDKLEEIRKKIKFSTANCANKITLMLDLNFFLSLVHEIQYYYKRRLISGEDFEGLKNEVCGLIDFLETCAQTGTFGQNATINIYVSSMNIGTNVVYTKCNGNETSFVSAFSTHPISMTHPAICEMHKRWITSVKKYSTLITKSNEMLQSEYFDKQREFIHSPGNELY